MGGALLAILPSPMAAQTNSDCPLPLSAKSTPGCTASDSRPVFKKKMGPESKSGIGSGGNEPRVCPAGERLSASGEFCTASTELTSAGDAEVVSFFKVSESPRPGSARLRVTWHCPANAAKGALVKITLSMFGARLADASEECAGALEKFFPVKDIGFPSGGGELQAKVELEGPCKPGIPVLLLATVEIPDVLARAKIRTPPKGGSGISLAVRARARSVQVGSGRAVPVDGVENLKISQPLLNCDPVTVKAIDSKLPEQPWTADLLF
jgi:hypothetical protein